MEDKNQDGWDSYQRLVLSEIQRISRKLENISAEQRQLHADIEVLKYKAGVFGSVGGALVMGVTLFFEHFKR